MAVKGLNFTLARSFQNVFDKCSKVLNLVFSRNLIFSRASLYLMVCCPLNNEDVGITNDLLDPSNIVKYMEKNLVTMKPHYSQHVLPVPWYFVILRFHCTLFISKRDIGPGLIYLCWITGERNKTS